MSTETTPDLVHRALAPLLEAKAAGAERIEGLKTLDSHIIATEDLPIPAAAKRELVANLNRQRKTIEQAWLADVGAELKAQAKELGLLLEVRVLQRQKKRKPAAKPAAPKAMPASDVDTTRTQSAPDAPGFGRTGS